MDLLYILLGIYLPFYLLAVSGEDNRRVFNGTEISERVQKFLVKLELRHGEFNSKCSGTIIDKNWIITASHCLIDTTLYDNVTVLVSQYQNGKYVTITNVSSKNCFVNPKFIENNNMDGYSMQSLRTYDVALVKTSKPIEFNTNTHALPLGSYRGDGAGVIAGFGLWEGYDYSEDPREGQVRFQYDDYFNAFRSLIGEENSWPGRGDSGGPLIYQNQLIGVVFGRQCFGYLWKQTCYNYYCSIGHNMDWIRSVMIINNKAV